MAPFVLYAPLSLARHVSPLLIACCRLPCPQQTRLQARFDVATNGDTARKNACATSQLPMRAATSQLPMRAATSKLPMRAAASQLPMRAAASQLPMRAAASQLPMRAAASSREWAPPRPSPVGA